MQWIDNTRGFWTTKLRTVEESKIKSANGPCVSGAIQSCQTTSEKSTYFREDKSMTRGCSLRTDPKTSYSCVVFSDVWQDSESSDDSDDSSSLNSEEAFVC